MKVLVTSTSFQDTPGSHQQLLAKQGYDLHYLRGPIAESEMLDVIELYDALICGDDELTANVLEKGFKSRLRYISKYGVGLDKIDLAKAAELGIPVSNCPGVNQISVAEHTMALLLSFVKNIPATHNNTFQGKWDRPVNTEIYGKRIGIAGFGAVGREVAKRAKAFGMQVYIYDVNIPWLLVKELDLTVCKDFNHLVKSSDVLSLHLPHTPATDKIINIDLVNTRMKNGVIIINTARGKLVDNAAIVDGIKNNIIGGYLTDVLDVEPMEADCPLRGLDRVIITTHLASRTYESVARQGSMAVENLVKMISKNEE